MRINALIKLCVDICKRNGKTKLLWFGDKDKSLNYEPASDEMVITVHRWFANKSCPGDWLYSRLGDLAAKVTAQLGGSTGTSDSGVLYRVQVGAYSIKANADAQLARVKEVSEKIAVLKSANMSMGINLLQKLLKDAAKVLAPAGYDMELVEKHHNQKLDAPSGTALANSAKLRRGKSRR